MIFGPQTYHELPQMVLKATGDERVVNTEFPTISKFDNLPEEQNQGASAFLSIQEGCDKFCTFCVVPYTRGAEVSRSVTQIFNEAHRLVAAGVKEITLLGQNVNAWHGQLDGEDWNLGKLLHELAKVDGIERLRYTTSHPIDMDQGLIDAHRDLPKLMPYLHLPVQAGSDRILKAMNRHHTKQQYLDIIAKVRAVNPDIAISGDFIIGFPGESDADFEETLDVIRQVKYASAFSFKYSPRPGTPGADMKDHVPVDVQDKRLAEVQALLREQMTEFNEGCVGKEIDLLIEKRGKREGQLLGRSPWLQTVVIDGDVSEISQTLRVRIDEAGPASLHGVRV